MKIRYTGKRAQQRDRLYGTGLVLLPQQVYEVPDEVGRRMLRHQDVYAEAATDAVVADGDVAAVTTAAPVDEEAEQQMLDALEGMNKPALLAYARDHFGQLLDRRLAVSALRQQVVNLVSRFGVQ